jgi:hypothetical protein
MVPWKKEEILSIFEKMAFTRRPGRRGLEDLEEILIRLFNKQFADKKIGRMDNAKHTTITSSILPSKVNNLVDTKRTHKLDKTRDTPGQTT